MNKPSWWNKDRLRRWKWFGQIGSLRRAMLALQSAAENQDLPPLIRATAREAAVGTKAVMDEMASFTKAHADEIRERLRRL